jgi:hypothetical protein
VRREGTLREGEGEGMAVAARHIFDLDAAERVPNTNLDRGRAVRERQPHAELPVPVRPPAALQRARQLACCVNLRLALPATVRCL